LPSTKLARLDYLLVIGMVSGILGIHHLFVLFGLHRKIGSSGKRQRHISASLLSLKFSTITKQ
jgi:hypothetical protein